MKKPGENLKILTKINNMSYSFAKTKFQSIRKRSFESFLDLFLICTYTSDKSLQSATIEKFKQFDYNDSRISEALGAYQLAKNTDNFCEVPLSQLDDAVKKWHHS
jgi:hypothetical protein